MNPYLRFLPLIIVAAAVIWLSYRLLSRLHAYQRARRAGVPVSLWQLLGMWLRKVSARKVLQCSERLASEGIAVPVNHVEMHELAGGDIERVTQAMVLARQYEQPLDWDMICAIDLAGRDVVDLIERTQHEEVIDVPLPESQETWVTARARDGWQLAMQGRATVRFRVEKLINGATEETLAARIASHLINQVARYEDHQQLIDAWETLEQSVLEANIAQGSIFDLLDFCITKMEPGDHIDDRLA